MAHEVAEDHGRRHRLLHVHALDQVQQDRRGEQRRGQLPGRALAVADAPREEEQAEPSHHDQRRGHLGHGEGDQRDQQVEALAHGRRQPRGEIEQACQRQQPGRPPTHLPPDDRRRSWRGGKGGRFHEASA